MIRRIPVEIEVQLYRDFVCGVVDLLESNRSSIDVITALFVLLSELNKQLRSELEKQPKEPHR